MRAKIGLITAFLLIVALAPALTYFNDLQSYDSVTNPTFTGNFTYIGTNCGSIQSNADDSVYLICTQGGAPSSLVLTPKANAVNIPFSFDFKILQGSTFSGTSILHTGLADFLSFAFLTNSSFQLPSSSGYTVTLFVDNNTVDNANITISLRRCSAINGQTYSCGVLLAKSNFTATNDLMYYASGKPVLNKSVSFNVTDDISGHIQIYFDGIERLSYYDKIYKSGNISIYDYAYSSASSLKFDNISISVTTGALSGWHLYSFPMNQLDLIGFGLYTGEVWQACPKSGTPIYNTPYQFSFGTIELDEPCFDWFYAGFPSNGTVMSPFFLLKYDGDWVSHTLTTTLNLSTVIGFQATHENTCYISNKYTGNGQLDWAIPVNGWVASVPIYIMSHRNGTYAQNNPYVFYGYDIYCVAPENLTFYLQTITYEPSFTSVLTTINVPIGVYIDPITGEVNYSRLSNFTYAPSVLRPCVPGDLRVICAPPGTAGGLITDFSGLSGLVTPLTVLLSAVLIAGAIITRDTKSSQIGLIAIMAGCLMLSYYGILPWYITVLITIGAGFFILSQVRTGVFGNAQSA